MAAAWARANVDTITNAYEKPNRDVEMVATTRFVPMVMKGSGPMNVNASTSPAFPNNDGIDGYLSPNLSLSH